MAGVISAAATWIVLDIEGTVSPTAVVQESLFGYARAHIRDFVAAHQSAPEVGQALAAARVEAGLPPTAGIDDVLDVLVEWIDADRKATPLKNLQGLLWHDAFLSGELAGVFFPDAPVAIRDWAASGFPIGVFSSGSVQAQRDWFHHGSDGDLGSLISANFDTSSAGPKRDAASYGRISQALGAPGSEILFLSDVPAELDAAQQAGWSTVGVVRESEPWSTSWFGTHPTISTFADLRIVPSFFRTLGSEVVDATARLAALGGMPATAGNVSRVVTDSPLSMLITASGVDKARMTWRQCVLIDAEGRPELEALVGMRPSAESRLHAHVARRTQAGAVVHTHALSSVLAGRQWPQAVRLSGVELLKALDCPADGELLVPVIANSQDMDELASRWDSASDKLRPGNQLADAFIVADHGLYAWGTDLDKARHVVEALDWLFQLNLASR